MSGSSCARTGCPTECSNASTTSSIIAAMPGTHSSTSHGRSCLSQDAHGLASVNQSEDWYKSQCFPVMVLSLSRTPERSFCHTDECMGIYQVAIKNQGMLKLGNCLVAAIHGTVE